MTKLESREWLLRQGVWEARMLKELLATDPKIEQEMARAFAHMRKPQRMQQLPCKPRLINHFAVGADPELEIQNFKGAYVGADTVKLHTGLAFGADLSGRQAELRPQASKWALEVVGSLLQELRWMRVYVAHKLRRDDFKVVASPWNGRDGFGGHVHFGRKRAQLRGTELKALDVVCGTLIKTGVFPDSGTRDRMRESGYGQFGDHREQAHGYEYRAFPTWMDSPWMAYFVLTLSKLIVARPWVAEALQKAVNGQTTWAYGRVREEMLRNIFGYFQGMDDDARLVAQVLQEAGLPRFVGGDIRGRWGMEGTVSMHTPPTIYPTCIPCSTLELQELFDHFVKLVPLKHEIPTLNWPNHTPAKGFVGVLERMSTHGKTGIGEICWDLCTLVENPWRVGAATRDGGAPDLQVNREAELWLPADWKARVRAKCSWVQGIRIVSTDHPEILVGSQLRQNNQIENARSLLTCGVFPIWRVGQEEPKRAWEFLVRRAPTAPKGRWGFKTIVPEGEDA